MENSVIIQKYRQTTLFYVLATVIPWAFWFAAAYVSYHFTPENRAANIATALGLAGLVSPMMVAFWLISRNRDLRKDAFGRFLNFQADKFWYYLLACLLMLASILLAQAVSLPPFFTLPQVFSMKFLPRTRIASAFKPLFC